MYHSVMIIGANGRMGQTAKKAINAMDGFNVTSLITRHDDLESHLTQNTPSLAIELSGHETVFDHCRILSEHSIPIVIGSSGLDNDQIDVLANQLKCKGVLVPNFSLAVAQFSSVLSSFVKAHNVSDIKIIEYHHTDKKDSPSGTAKHIARILKVDEDLILSVRDDKYHARHDVVFILEDNETITLSVESKDRDAYITGLQKACRYGVTNKTFKIGLESII